MTLHCPHCRSDNASTTRFCIECGAVLVESTPGGGRRRVLRPWGLRKSAPLTESPALPEMAAARKAARRAAGNPRRPVYKIAAGIAGIVALSGVIAYPYASPGPGPSREEEVVAKATTQVVAIADLTAVKERVVAAPADPERTSEIRAPAPAAPAPAPDQALRTVRPPPVEAAVPIAQEAPAEPVVVAAPPPQAPEPPRAVADPWQPLRAALSACSRVQGLWDRATCEQSARLASCDGHWGAVPLCPAGRTDFGQ